MIAALRALTLAATCLASGCADEAPGSEAAAAAARGGAEDRAAPAPLQDEAPEPSPWPTDVRSLHESVERFETVESCIRGLRPSLPLEVAEHFADLEYVDALGEVCRGLAAVERGDPAGCDALVSSAVSRQCRTRLATYHGRPDACPPSRTQEGARDALCLAWATRDASLCDAAPAAASARCLAVATGDAARCRRDRARASCEALVARLGDRVRADAPPGREPSQLTLEGEFGPASPLRLSTEVGPSLERGVVLTAEACDRQAILHHPLSVREPSVGLTLEVRWSDEGAATLGPGSQIEIGPVGTGYALHGTADLAEREPRLGATLRGTYEATFTRDGESHALTGAFRTFVRDLLPLPERCTAAED